MTTRQIFGPASEDEKPELCVWCGKSIGTNSLMGLLLLDENRNVVRGIYAHVTCPEGEDDAT
jgi:hypothetical protein